MKALKNKSLATNIGCGGKGAGATVSEIKLVAVSDADRQKLRIPVYPYLLP